MPTFSSLDLLDAVLVLMIAHPAYAWLFCGTCIGLSIYMAYRSGVKITQKPSPKVQQQNAAVAFHVAQDDHATRAAHLRIVSRRMHDDSEVA